MRVVVYTAADCGLCASAVDVVRQVCGEEFELVDITGDPALETAYRTSLPVVELDGERAFTYFVSADALRRRFAQR